MMKRIFSAALLFVLLFTIAVPVSAVSTIQNAHQCIGVTSATDGVLESTVYKSLHLDEKKMMEILTLALEQEDCVVPQDAGIKHLTMIRQKNVTCDTAPIEYTMHTWTAVERHVVAFFLPEGEEVWQVVGYALGNDISFTLPGNGQYAVAWSW